MIRVGHEETGFPLQSNSPEKIGVGSPLEEEEEKLPLLARGSVGSGIL